MRKLDTRDVVKFFAFVVMSVTTMAFLVSSWTNLRLGLLYLTPWGLISLVIATIGSVYYIIINTWHFIEGLETFFRFEGY